MRRLLETFAARNKVPAVVGAVVSGAEPVAIHVVGVRRRGGGEPATFGDAWHIGSCGKSLTAALYGRLVESGAAAWREPVTNLLPDLRHAIHPAWADRTVDEVLHCRSGMRANPTRAALNAGYLDTRPLPAQRTDAALLALGVPPGTQGRFVYSNLGYVVVGAAIDRIAGMPYERALEEELLAPLGITSLGFGPPPLVWGHGPRLHLRGLCLFPGKPADPAKGPSDNPPFLSSAGTMHLTMGDWGRFIRLFVTDGGGLLQASTVDHLLRVPEGRGRPMAMGWVHAPHLDGVSYVMQGSNTMWAATVVLDARRTRAGLVVANDGRTSVVMRSATLAAQLLEQA